MCTNYRPTSSERARQLLGIDMPAFEFRDEVYPGHQAPIVRVDNHKGESKVECIPATYGVIPIWSKTGKDYRHCYNARTETVAAKPSFRNAWRKGQFCVVPMDAFYEPNYETGKPVRWRIERNDGEPMFVGGLWDVWKNPQGDDVMNRFHAPDDEKRALVMLSKNEVDAWLHATVEDAAEFLEPYPAEVLTTRPDPRPPAKRTARYTE